MQAIVLAAAGGPEFGPLCQGSSKGMLPFLGQPLLARVIRYLERHGAHQVLVNLCEHPYPVEHHFSQHPPTQASLKFHLEAEVHGTAGAVKRMASGAQTRACRGPTISGQRVTTLDWTKPKRRKAVRPISGIRSEIARACPPRGRS